MKNRNNKVHYATNGKLLQPERHYDLFRTIAVFNAVLSSNINIKEIFGNCKCPSLAKRLFDASGLLSWW